MQGDIAYCITFFNQERWNIIKVIENRASQVAQMVKNLPAVWETQVWSLGWKDPLEKGMATHSSLLAWRIPAKRSLVGYSLWGHKELDKNTGLINAINCWPHSRPGFLVSWCCLCVWSPQKFLVNSKVFTPNN